MNDLFFCLKSSDLHNFTDGNTITVTCNNLTDFLKTIESAWASSRLVQTKWSDSKREKNFKQYFLTKSKRAIIPTKNRQHRN